ncbi:MAG TPA: hypothetical protein ENH44_01540 [Actinobacteria bacterium]|nr:hypothetical protein [Actinomycetota bacterium]
MFSALLISLREGLEAVLILVIVISFLRRLGEGRLVRYAWGGAAGALAFSLIAGGALFVFAGELGEEAAEMFEVGGNLLALAVLTYVIIWMRNHGAGLKGGLELRTRQAVQSATPLAISLLAFAAVGREGLETVLFLFAGASSSQAASMVAGAASGFTLAALAGIAIYRGSARLNLRLFFNVTGVLLILFGAGILSHVLQEAGEPGFIPAVLTGPLWDTSRLLGHGSGFGAILGATFGYYATPSLVQVTGYWAYLTVMLWLYLKPSAGRVSRPASQEA